MNPLAALLPALYAALATPPLQWQGVTVPVGQFVGPTWDASGHYVLLTQPTDTDLGRTAGCWRFTCTVLIDVVTQFGQNALSAAPAEAIVSQVNDRLRGVRLALPLGWDCQPGTMQLASQVEETDGDLVAVRRLLRYRWDVYYNL